MAKRAAAAVMECSCMMASKITIKLRSVLAIKPSVLISMEMSIVKYIGYINAFNINDQLDGMRGVRQGSVIGLPSLTH
jgi:UDP-N-acetylmuramyl pentapeptide phosphotransferase/UDP-N-acetylglucosamine-1-phosphate transferase